MDYYGLTYVLLLVAVIMSFWAQFKVNHAFKKYSEIYSRTGLTGAQVAERILRANGIDYVAIDRVNGSMTDHFHPGKNTLFLSETVYGETTVAAIAVAAHECGHAIQHDVGYLPLGMRSALVPVCNFGNYASWILLLLGLLFSIGPLVSVGIICFSLIVLFQIITLPVEFNASSRAIAQIKELGLLADDEIGAGEKVLSAAAFTYVAAAVVAIMQLLRLLAIFGNRR